MRSISWGLSCCMALAAWGCDDPPCLPSGEVTVRALGTLYPPHGELANCFQVGQIVTLGGTRTAWLTDEGDFSFDDAGLTATVDPDQCRFTIAQDLSSDTQTGEAHWYAEDKKSRQRWEGFGVIALTRADGECGNSIAGVTIDVVEVQ